MFLCVLFVVGNFNYVTPGCLQGTPLVTPNVVVKTHKVPINYKQQIIPYRRQIIEFEDTIKFSNVSHWNRFDSFWKEAQRTPKSPRYAPAYKWLMKGIKKRYLFHLRLRTRQR